MAAPNQAWQADLPSHAASPHSCPNAPRCALQPPERPCFDLQIPIHRSGLWPAPQTHLPPIGPILRCGRIAPRIFERLQPNSRDICEDAIRVAFNICSQPGLVAQCSGLLPIGAILSLQFNAPPLGLRL